MTRSAFPLTSGSSLLRAASGGRTSKPFTSSLAGNILEIIRIENAQDGHLDAAHFLDDVLPNPGKPAAVIKQIGCNIGEGDLGMGALEEFLSKMKAPEFPGLRRRIPSVPWPSTVIRHYLFSRIENRPAIQEQD